MASREPADALDRFAAAAQAYCAWCRSEFGDEREEVRLALLHLSTLLAAAQGLRLPAISEVDIDLDGRDAGYGTETWTNVYRRHAGLAVGDYWHVFDPHELDTSEPVCGDLQDDLADIHADLASGLSLYELGHRAEAEYEWLSHFRFHWGEHAASALRALHIHCSRTGRWPT